MSVEKMTVSVIEPDGKWLYRVGGISALVIGIGYIIISPLFAHVGGTSVEWWRGLAQVPRRKDDGLVGYAWTLRPNGLSLRTCRAIAIRCVGTGQQKRNAHSNGIRGVVRCLRHGSYVDKLRLAPHAQRFTRRSHERRSAGGLRRGCKLCVSSVGIPYGSFLLHSRFFGGDSHHRFRYAERKGNHQ